MNCVTNGVNDYSFTSRCGQIRDAQWVCHVINDFQYSSTSRLKPLFEKQLRKVKKLNPQVNSPMDMLILEEHLNSLNLSKPKNKNLFKKFADYIKSKFLKDKKDDLNRLYSIKEKIKGLADIREKCMTEAGESKQAFSALKMLDEYKQGNCYETAILAQLVLKLNGVKNARVLYLKNGSKLEHAVCVFNRDGSKFEKIENNKTIFVDPWAGKADFAGNMFKYYDSILGNNFRLKMKFDDKLEINDFAALDEVDFNKIKGRYPTLIKTGGNRKFMEK